MRPPLLIAASALALSAASAAVAQSGPPVPVSPEAPSEWRVDVGAGVLARPDYSGSDDYETSLLPAFAVSYGDVFTIRPGDGARLRAFKAGEFEGGLGANVRFGRDESDNPALRGLGDVDTALEGGGYVAWRSGPWSVSASAVTALTDGYDGVIGEVGATWTGVTPVGLLSVGPRLRFVTDDVNQTYYGIDAAQAARSGRAVYTPGGGLQGAGVGAGLLIPLGERLTLGALANYDRLLGDAADSPIVREGSRDQVTAGVFIGYRLF